MYLSVISIGGWYSEYSEMMIPKVIGKISRFIHNTKSIRKLLPVGHRYRGDVEVL
jgi:hypothetical protein